MNEQCYQDFRAGLCTSQHDFVMLTDHPAQFTDHEFPDTLLYRSDAGDSLVAHGAGPTASWLACPHGPPALVLAGTESTSMMPVGLEDQVPDRDAVYNSWDGGDVLTVENNGAVGLVAHTEGWTADQLSSLPLDGFEMYNLHANTIKNLPLVADWVLAIDQKQFDGLPDPNTFLSAYNLEDPAYLTTWGTVLFRGYKRVTTMATDCHRNTLPQIAQDGDRIDSYRRMMEAFSNHLLITPNASGSYDDRDLKAALRAERLYGAFDFMGYPIGFDFYGQEAGAAGAIHEMGEEVAVGATLHIAQPKIQNLDPGAMTPTISTHLYVAIDGGWNEVASNSGPSLTFTTVSPGAYRAEIRMTPVHLRAFMGKRLDLIHADRPWVYSNAIYVK